MSDATVGVNGYFLGLEMLGALDLIPKTLVKYVRVRQEYYSNVLGISRIKLQTGMP